MRWSQVNSTGSIEQAFGWFKNVQAVSVTDGDALVLDTSTFDGARVTQPASASLSLFVGLANGTIAAGAYGEVNTYGYKAAGLETNDTNVSIAAGNILVPVAAADYLAYSAAGDGKSGLVMAGEAYASDATPSSDTIAVFIRAC